MPSGRLGPAPAGGAGGATASGASSLAALPAAGLGCEAGTSISCRGSGMDGGSVGVFSRLFILDIPSNFEAAGKRVAWSSGSRAVGAGGKTAVTKQRSGKGG